MIWSELCGFVNNTVCAEIIVLESVLNISNSSLPPSLCVSLHRIVFDSNEQCIKWYQRLTEVTGPISRLEDLFSFTFHAWCLDAKSTTDEACTVLCQRGGAEDAVSVQVDRQHFIDVCYCSLFYRGHPTLFILL